MLEKKEKKETENKSKIVSLGQLFRFANGSDYLLMVAGSLAAMINGATLPLMTIFLGDILTAFVSDPATLDETVKDGVIKMCIIGAAAFTFSYLQMSLWMLAGENQAQKIRQSFFKSILRQDVGWFDRSATGELTNRLAVDINLIQEGMSDKVGVMIQNLATFITGFIVAYTKGWQLSLVLTGTLPVLAGMAVFMTKLLSGGSSEEQDAYAGANAIAQQALSSVKTVVAFGAEDKEIVRYNEKLDEAEKKGVKKAFVNGVGIGGIQLVIFLVYSLAFWYGNTLVPDTLQSGEVVNVIFAVIIAAFSIGTAAPHVTAITTAMGAAYKVFEIIDRESPIDALHEKGESPASVEGLITFRGVDFHYPTRDDVPVLKNFNLTVESGKTVALVGSSGSGKSTAVKLFERFYDPVAGDVLLDGRDIRQLNVKWLRQQIGMVSQEPCLFDTTIRENILLGLNNFEHLSSDTQLKMIEDACRQANCWDFINQLPQKLETQVGEAGSMLSGGQKQRIAIARAIIKNPRILLLDEATSALDTESERVVQAALEKASENRTTIVIAHRLSTVKNADQIVVMSRGEIQEQGTHKELIDKGGMYADLVKTQEIKKKDGVEETTEEADAPGQDAKKSVVSVSSEQKSTVVLKKPKTEKELQKEKEEKEAELLKGYKVDYGRLIKWNKPELWLFGFGLLGAAANGASQPLFAILFSDILTALGTPRANDFALLFLALGFGAFLANFFQIGVFSYAGEKMTRRVREACFRALLRQEMGFYDEDKNSTGALTGKLGEDAGLIQGLTGQTMGSILQALAGIITGFVIAFVASWRLSLLVLAMVPIISLSGYLEMRSLAGYGEKTREAYEKTNQKANEAIQNVRTIVTITQEHRFYSTYESSIVVPHNMTVQGAFVSSFGFAFSQSTLHFSWAVAFYYGAQLVKWGLNGPGDVFKAMFSIIFTAIAAGQVSNFMPNAAKAKLALMAVFELLDRESKIDVTKEVGEQREKAEGQVDGKDLEFAYPSRPDTQILKGLDVFAKPGQTIALVGHSGCGKSTVMGLALRWYDATGGRLDFDGLNVKDWNVRTLRSFLGLVGQEPVLFDMSIRDNITYGLTHQPDDLAIHEAAKAANIHGFIMEQPDKYDTVVGEKGGKLSGGQKQRVAIARALIRNPKLLLLDEATSALDSESEAVVQAALDHASQGRTTLVIAHRLSTIQNADVILVVEKGKIIESGTHFELVDKRGRYADLVSQQNLK